MANQNLIVTSLRVLPDMHMKITEAVEKRKYRSNSDLMRVGIEKVLNELLLEEQQKQQLSTAPVTAAPTGQRGIVAASPLTGAEIQTIPAAAPIIPQETTEVT